jgi:hypothetical protein
VGAVDVTQQPIFYLFIAATVLLTLGYSWGRRRNKRIYLSAFNALVETLSPKDQNFTTIGGLTGYHANLIPYRNKFIRRVDATITLLPRQSWLYYPISKLTRRYDRLFLTLFYSKKASKLLPEGHLIEERYSRFRGPKITNIESLQHEELQWEGTPFHLYYQSDEMRDSLLKLKEKLGSPGELRHLALVPDREQAFLFMVPKRDHVGQLFPVVYRWLDGLLEKRYKEKESQKRDR